MLESEKFIPSYPCPHKNKLTALPRFIRGWKSWIHTLFEKSYKAQMGHVKMPHLDVYVVNTPDLVRNITETHSDGFQKHYIQREILCPLIGNSLFTANGEEWRKQREMINPAFSHTRLSLSFPTMQAATADMMQRLELESQGNKPVEIDPLMTHVTADIIFRTILSKTIDDKDARDIFSYFNQYQDWTQRIITCRIYGFPSPILNYRQKKSAEGIRSILKPLIAARYGMYHKNGENKQDILGTMLEARTPDTNEPFSLNDLVDQVCMLFLAGHETSASALTWSLYLLSRCPHLQEAMRAQIRDVTQGRPITHGMLRHFSHVQNVFNESLRLFPPVSFLPREPLHDTHLRDKFVKKGAMVTISPWLIHRHQTQWPNPDQFAPDRWEDATQKDTAKQSFLPFGKGARICVGQGFARQEALLILATIINAYQIEYKNLEEPEPVARVTLRPHKPIALYFCPVK